MIAHLKGIVENTGDGWAVIDVNGVGYRVFCSARTLANMPSSGQAISLKIETHIREDHFHLYGFIDQAELDWFKLLTTVQGVGAKLCLAILSALPPDQLTNAIISQDKTTMIKANGVGAKLATRIVTELKDKVAKLATNPSMVKDNGSSGASVDNINQVTNKAADDAISALVNLGYSRSDAFNAVLKAKDQLGDNANISALIRHGLQELSQ